MPSGLQSSITYILALREGKTTTKMDLAKLLYLADYYYSRTFGKGTQFLDARWELAKFGPLPNPLYRDLRTLKASGIIDFSDTTHVVTLLNKQWANQNQPAETYAACAERVVDDTREFTTSELKNATYSTEPVQTAKAAAAPINPRAKKVLSLNGTPRHPLWQDVDTSVVATPEFAAYISSH